jgi:hypothetical protein
MFIFQVYLGPAAGSPVSSVNLKTILHRRTYPPVTSEDLAAAGEKFATYWVLLPPSETELDEATVARMYEAVKRSITALGRPLIVQGASGFSEELVSIFTDAGFKSEIRMVTAIKKLPDGKLVVNEDLVSPPQ